MTTTEKSVQIALGTYLPEVWKKRCVLADEGHKLIAEGHKLYIEGQKLWADGRKCVDERSKRIAEGHARWNEGSKLTAKGDNIRAGGHLLFIRAVKEVYGKEMTIEWTTYGCKLSNGMEFRNDA